MSDNSKPEGGQCVDENSTGGNSLVIRNSANIFESSSKDKPQYFVHVVKNKRRTKNNNLEFLIGWCVFPDPLHDTWEPLVTRSHTSSSFVRFGTYDPAI